jgi:hypothetical protein
MEATVYLFSKFTRAHSASVGTRRPEYSSLDFIDHMASVLLEVLFTFTTDLH